MEGIIILSNIGSASKKYSVYQGDIEIAWFHLEKTAEEFLVSYKINSVFENFTLFCLWASSNFFSIRRLFFFF
jgi:hypothetical protein